MNVKTRPCRPGDILSRSESSCGAYYFVRVQPPTPHPPSGVTGNHNVKLDLIVAIPSLDGLLPHSFRDHNTTVCGEYLLPDWGYPDEKIDRVPCRYHREVTEGPAIGPMLRELIAQGDVALADIQSVVSAHIDSVECQRSARESAYAAFPVADTNQTPPVEDRQ